MSEIKQKLRKEQSEDERGISIVTKDVTLDERFKIWFVTRAIERGMNPKTLQKILGHGTLQMTMDLYCHVTEDTLYKEMKKFERGCVLKSNGVAVVQ